jgi:hypothetical protein
MITYLEKLKYRNYVQYISVCFSIFGALVCMLLILISDIKVLNINAFIKPLKFFLSGGIFCYTMGWYCYYLPEQKAVKIYSWMVLLVLLFENLYILLKASQGQLSHFNITSAFNGFMFSMMGIAIVALTIWTGFIGFLFFKNYLPHLPRHYVWSIRIAIVLFVFFAFEGDMMASILKHTVGANDGGKGLQILNWSTENGDLRVSHFFGMHSLQIIPLVAFYLLKSTKKTILFSVFYLFVCLLLLLQAIKGLPFVNL